MASRRPIRVLITTGDQDGIGWEVTAKALADLGPTAKTQFIYFRAPDESLTNNTGAEKRTRKFFNTLTVSVKRRFKIKAVPSLDDALEQPHNPKVIIEILSTQSPVEWVEHGTKACQARQIQALVTAPLSKTTIAQSGRSDIGHTEILGRVTGAKSLFMGFQGAKFSVVLATGHRSVVDAIQSLDQKVLEKALIAADQLRSILPPTIRKRPMAIVGVNPHASEGGLIGSEDVWITRLVKQHRWSKRLTGPLVPDAAFLPQNWQKYSVFIAPYHDQGLIPFKLVHGFDSGVHLTLGLPFVRVSVDHGCGKDIFGLNRAKHGSMKDAIRTAIRLAKEESL